MRALVDKLDITQLDSGTVVKLTVALAREENPS